MIGHTLGHFRIVEKIGEGGMGVVYRAHDERLDRDVALKVLPAEALTDDDARRSFRREALALSRLNHPNIATIFDFDRQGGVDFLVMEYIPGQSLAASLARGRLTDKDVAALGAQIAAALEEAHDHGIIHRDLKPHNVMVTPKRQVKVLDFGLATLLQPHGVADATRIVTEVQAVAGTLPYMAPEQLRNERLDARTDIHALGAVLYEMATGRQAFSGQTTAIISDEILHHVPVPPSRLNPECQPRLQEIILKALEKDPELRYQTAAELRADLRRLTRDVETTLSQPLQAPAPAGGARRTLLRASAVVGAIALLFGGWAVYRWVAPRPPMSTKWMQLTNFADSAVAPALSRDGRMVTFVRGPKTFFGPGQIYVKVLPDGEPQQLTHDDRMKMAPVFSPDGSRIVYATVWPAETWSVPILGGEPRLLMPNACALTWIDKEHALFSEIKDGIHMAIVTATESRSESRDVYVPPESTGMAHFSYLSPDSKWVLVVEMDKVGWLPCRLVPFDGSSAGKPVGPPKAPCTSAAWSRDGSWMYFGLGAGDGFHIWRQRFPDGVPEQVTSGPTEEQGIAMDPDGRSFVTAVGIERSAVWVRDAEGERQVSLEGDGYLPDFWTGRPRSMFSSDGKKLYFLVRRGGSFSWSHAGELWVSDLDSGRNDQLLPGFLVNSYDISSDEKQIVFSAREASGSSRIWLAPLDRRTPPRLLPAAQADSPVFGAQGEILVRLTKGNSSYLYRMNQDGGGLEAALSLPIIALQSVSPNGKWAIVNVPSEGRAWDTLAYPTSGGPPVRVCSVRECSVEWAVGGKYLYVSFMEGEHTTFDTTYLLPVKAGQDLPALPAAGIGSEADVTRLPGVKVIRQAGIAVGHSPSVYAFSRTTVQRNLFRIPLN